MTRRRARSLAGLVVLGVGLFVVLGFVGGGIGPPSVGDAHHRIAGVNESTTLVETTVPVDNPLPFGLTLDGLSVNYTLRMNGLAMGGGRLSGLAVGPDRSTLEIRTALANDRIPAWWYSHVSNGERTVVGLNATVTHGLLGETRVSVPADRPVRTDVLGQFNDSSTRSIDADLLLLPDPVLFVNETTATWGRPLTRARTPIDLSVAVYNPTPVSYCVSEARYTMRMNGVVVGSGRTTDVHEVDAESAETIRTRVVIDNDRLDEWWMRHLERDQTTLVEIDFSLRVDPDTAMGDAEPVWIDHPKLDYETTFETSIFERASGPSPTDADEGRPEGI